MALDRDDIITDAAYKAANRHYDTFTSKGVNIDPEDRALQGLSRNDAVEALAIRYADRIKDGYPEEGWGEGPGSRLRDASDGDLLNWLNGAGDSPEQQHEKQVFSEYEDLVKDGKWYSMSPAELKLKMSSKNLGFNPEDPEDVRRFYDTLAQFETDYNKALAVDEFSRSGWGVANALMNPTAYGVAVKQALTDEPLDKGEVWKGGATDIAATGIMGGLGRIPNAIGAGVAMAGTELGRQAIASRMLGLDLDPTMVAGSFAAGATVPGMARGIGRFVAQSTNPSISRFGKEMVRGARGYNPTIDEKNELKALLLGVREMSRDPNYRMQLSGKDLDVFTTTPATAEFDRKQGELMSKARLLGIDKKTVAQMGGGAIYRNEKAAKQADKALWNKLENAYDAPFTQASRMEGATADDLAKAREATKSLEEARASAFLEKWAQEANVKQRRGVGYALGGLLGGVGGIVEPAYHVNPMSISSELLSGDMSGNMLKSKTEDYKEQQWYRELREKYPEQAAAIDAAFKKKEGK